MNDTKARRQRAIVELINQTALASQDLLARQLAEQGFQVTQATISRDLEQIGAIKIRRGGNVGYALPDQAPSPVGGPSRLAIVLRDWVRSIEAAGTMVVLKTPPGSAHLVGVALDEAALAEIVGTICGDDTIFAACRSEADAKQTVARLRASAVKGAE